MQEHQLDIEPTDSRRPGTPPSVALGAAIRRARRGRFTLVQLAERSGVSTGLLSLIERGRGNPSINTMAAIADALDVSLPELVAEAARGSEEDEPGSALVVALGDIEGGVSPASSGLAESGLAGWGSSLVLRGGQEARIKVLDGTLELVLRDRTSPAAAADGRPLSVDLTLRSVAPGAPARIPPVDDPRWRDLARGEIPFEPSTLAARMLFTHIVRCVRQDSSSPNIERWVRELRGLFVKYESVSAGDLAQIFGPGEAA